MTALLIDSSTPTGVPIRRRGGGLLTAVRSSRKAMVGVAIFLVFAVLAAVPQLFTSVRDPNALEFQPGLGSSREHLLGTTALGQDIFAQLVYGTRQSLVIALVAGLFATVLSVMVGVSAAYLGGVSDEALSMLTNVFLVLPTFPLIIILATYAGKGTLPVILIVLVVTGWSYGANQLRAQTLSLRNRDFVESAKVRGERRSYVIFREVLPTMTSLIVANVHGAALNSVLTAAGLQFLGLGDPNSISWGTMLYWANNGGAMLTGQWAWLAAPGLALALLTTSLILINFGVDALSNPQLREE